MPHLQCVDKTDLHICWKPLNSNIQYLERYRFCLSNGTHTHSAPNSRFPLNAYFQQPSARRGNQALDHRLKSYQLHLFLSPCYHSIHSSPLSLTNPSLPHLSPLRPRDPRPSSLSSLPLFFSARRHSCAHSLLIIRLCFPPSHPGLTHSCSRHRELRFPLSYQQTFISSSSASISPSFCSPPSTVHLWWRRAQILHLSKKYYSYRLKSKKWKKRSIATQMYLRNQKYKYWICKAAP